MELSDAIGATSTKKLVMGRSATSGSQKRKWTIVVKMIFLGRKMMEDPTTGGVTMDQLHAMLAPNFARLNT